MKHQIIILFITLLTFNLSAQIVIVDNLSVEELARKISTNRIVGLGEKSHGYKNTDVIKVALIKELQKNHGFDAIIFESSFCDNWAANQLELSPIDDMKQRLYKMWHNADVLELFELKKEGNIQIYGCDLKGQSGTYNELFSKEMIGVLSQIDIELGESFRLMEESTVGFRTQFSIKKNIQTGRDSIDRLIKKYDQLLQQVNSYSGFKLDEKEWVKACLYNRKDLLSFVKIPYSDFIKVSNRDKVMSRNLQWLLNNPLKGKKVIIWAANSHIAKNYYYENMIVLFPDNLKSDMYSIAIRPKKMANKGQRKLLSSETGGRYLYVDKEDDDFNKKDKDVFDGVIYSEGWERSVRIER